MTCAVVDWFRDSIGHCWSCSSKTGYMLYVVCCMLYVVCCVLSLCLSALLVLKLGHLAEGGRKCLVIDGFYQIDRLASEITVPNSAVRLYAILSTRGSATVSSLAKSIGVHKSYVSRLVSALESSGWVIRTGSNHRHLIAPWMPEKLEYELADDLRQRKELSSFAGEFLARVPGPPGPLTQVP